MTNRIRAEDGFSKATAALPAALRGCRVAGWTFTATDGGEEAWAITVESADGLMIGAGSGPTFEDAAAALEWRKADW